MRDFEKIFVTILTMRPCLWPLSTSSLPFKFEVRLWSQIVVPLKDDKEVNLLPSTFGVTNVIPELYCCRRQPMSVILIFHILLTKFPRTFLYDEAMQSLAKRHLHLTQSKQMEKIFHFFRVAMINQLPCVNRIGEEKKLFPRLLMIIKCARSWVAGGVH